MKPDAHGLPSAIYTSEQVRALDKAAIARFGIPGFELMTRAADAAFAALLERWPNARNVVVFCGAGDNAGDGYLVARLAHARGMSVRVVAVGNPERLRGNAARAWAQCAEGKVPLLTWPLRPETGFTADVIVDALLGTGLDRDLEPAYAAAVQYINSALEAPVLAMDVPSGLDAETGLPRGDAVHADLTITFVALKQGLYLGRAPDYCGDIACADLGLPAEAARAFAPAMTRLSDHDLDAALPPRPRTAHKGSNGRLLLVGGGPGMPGAIRLAAEAALRAGAGLVYVATHAGSVASVMAGRPEILCSAVERPADLDALVAPCDAVVLGPGLGQSAWAESLWRHLVRVERPLVLDADGLNLLVKHPVERQRWILTPHAGEAARLLGNAPSDVEHDRLASVRAIARHFRAVTVLKGARSLVAQPDESEKVSVAVCDRGNPGMATAGMGDVLSGVLGALLVQCRDAGVAARAGVLLHALAGDDAAAAGERGTLASDLLPHIRRRANPH
jgi:NAD(P)H-hydrate epimerase